MGPGPGIKRNMESVRGENITSYLAGIELVNINSTDNILRTRITTRTLKDDRGPIDAKYVEEGFAFKIPENTGVDIFLSSC